MFEIAGLFSGIIHLFTVSFLVKFGDNPAGAQGVRQIQLVVPNPSTVIASLVRDSRLFKLIFQLKRRTFSHGVICKDLHIVRGV